MTPGRAAYEKWCELVIHPPTWPWDALPKTAKDGWEAIAQAAINQFLDSHTCGTDPAEPKCINCP